MTKEEPMLIHTVYDHPRDYPWHYVVRASTIEDGEARPHDACALFLFLDKARAWIVQEYPGAVCLPRSPEDDPVILEVWM